MANVEFPDEVANLLQNIGDPSQRNATAAALSKVAAKAEDDVLEGLAVYAREFVDWLNAEEPLVRAYTACILANIAFLEPGQKRVLDAGGVGPLMRLLKQKKEDTKVTLHSTAAIQNLTYKNTACCSEVLDNGGEKALKSLLSHKKEDVQQFAAGALANLQLYKRKDDEGLAPLPKSGVARKVAKILRRKGGGGSANDSPRGTDAGGPSGASPGSESGSVHGGRVAEAAMMIQAQYRGMQARRQYEQMYRNQKRKKTNKYDVFRVNDVRKELAVMEPADNRGNMGGGRLPMVPNAEAANGLFRKQPGGLPGLGGNATSAGRLPARLAPIGGAGGLPKLPGQGSAASLAPLGHMGGGLPAVPAGPRSGVSQFGAGFNPAPANLGAGSRPPPLR